MTSLDFSNNIATLTLDNHPDNQLLSPEFIDLQYLQKFIEDHHVKTLIITGTGRHFSSGADVNMLKQQMKNGDLPQLLNKGKELLNYLYELNIPVICAIEGVCFGGGLEIALSAHIRIVSERALLSFPETIHELMPGLSGNYNLKNYFTLGKSIELILSNRIINAEQALNEGLADYLCPNKKSYEFAMDLALKMTQGNSLQIINNVVIAIKNAYTMPRELALEEETKMFCQLAKNLSNEEQ